MAGGNKKARYKINTGRRIARYNLTPAQGRINPFNGVIIYYRVIDPRAAIYEIVNLEKAIDIIVQKKLEDMVSVLDLTNNNQQHHNNYNTRIVDTINSKLKAFGIRVDGIELISNQSSANPAGFQPSNG